MANKKVRMVFDFEIEEEALQEYGVSADKVFEHIVVGEDDVIDGFYITTDIPGIDRTDAFFLKYGNLVSLDLLPEKDQIIENPYIDYERVTERSSVQVYLKEFAGKQQLCMDLTYDTNPFLSSPEVQHFFVRESHSPELLLTASDIAESISRNYNASVSYSPEFTQALNALPIDNDKIQGVFESIKLKLETALRSEDPDHFIDVCVEQKLPGYFAPDYTVVIWGEEGYENDDKYFSIGIWKNGLNSDLDEPVMASNSDSAEMEDFELAFMHLLKRFELSQNIKKSKNSLDFQLQSLNARKSQNSKEPAESRSSLNFSKSQQQER